MCIRDSHNSWATLFTVFHLHDEDIHGFFSKNIDLLMYRAEWYKVF